MLSGSYEYLLDKLQKVQNNAARLITKTPRRQHITPILFSLHWLPVRSRIKYKVACICYSFFAGTGPAYLSDMLTPYKNLSKLRSSSDNRLLDNPKTMLNSVTFGERAFMYQGPLIWNSLPQNIRFSPSPSAFRSALKTHLFRLAF